MSRVVIVLAGGDPVEASVKAHLPQAELVVAADSGVHAASVLGVHVDHIVGDFDSADARIVDAVVAAGATAERHPVDKDATDLELALDAACAHEADAITVVGGAGGRLDHLLANIAVLAAPKYAGVAIDALVGAARVGIVHGGRAAYTVHADRGAIVTLLPYHGVARGIVTTGLQFGLDGDDLAAGTSRGVSNVVVASPATVALAAGTLAVVQPGGGAQ